MKLISNSTTIIIIIIIRIRIRIILIYTVILESSFSFTLTFHSLMWLYVTATMDSFIWNMFIILQDYPSSDLSRNHKAQRSADHRSRNCAQCYNITCQREESSRSSISRLNSGPRPPDENNTSLRLVRVVSEPGRGQIRLPAAVRGRARLLHPVSPGSPGQRAGHGWIRRRIRRGILRLELRQRLDERQPRSTGVVPRQVCRYSRQPDAVP